MVVAHVFKLSEFLHVCIAFLAFSFSASAVYVFNDVFDISSDRNHHSKKYRPIPCGEMSVQFAAFLFTSFFMAICFVNYGFFLILCVYWLLNLIYSLYFKKEIVADIVLLSGMYTVRVFAGGCAAHVPVSSWLLSLCTFFFFSLACLKRYLELVSDDGDFVVRGRGYLRSDQLSVYVLGVVSGLLSILVFLMYLQSPEVKVLYRDVWLLWLLTPLLLYWVSRVWFLALRKDVNEDPVLFAVKDRISWVCLLIACLVICSAFI